MSRKGKEDGEIRTSVPLSIDESGVLGAPHPRDRVGLWLIKSFEYRALRGGAPAFAIAQDRARYIARALVNIANELDSPDVNPSVVERGEAFVRRLWFAAQGITSKEEARFAVVDAVHVAARAHECDPASSEESLVGAAIATLAVDFPKNVAGLRANKSLLLDAINTCRRESNDTTKWVSMSKLVLAVIGQKVDAPTLQRTYRKHRKEGPKPPE